MFKRGKRIVAPDHQDSENTVQGNPQTIQNKEHREKSRRVESPNDESCHERSRCEKSPHQGSRLERGHREKSHHEGFYHEKTCRKKSHWERRHREKCHHGESHNNHRDEEVEDLKKKYAFISRQIMGEDLKSTI